VIRLEAVDKEDWSSANRMDCLKNAVPFERSATGSPLLKTTPRRDLSTLRCSQRTLGIHSSRGRPASRRGRNSHAKIRPQLPSWIHGRKGDQQMRSPHPKALARRQRRRKREPLAAWSTTARPKRRVRCVRCTCGAQYRSVSVGRSSNDFPSQGGCGNLLQLSAEHTDRIDHAGGRQ
jgi:hypothetical protein